MNLSNVNIGTGPSAGDGDPLRSAFTTINNNFQLVTNNVNALTNSVNSVNSNKNDSGNQTNTTSVIIAVVVVFIVMLVFIAFLCFGKKKEKHDPYQVWTNFYETKQIRESENLPTDIHHFYNKSNTPSIHRNTSFVPHVSTRSSTNQRRSIMQSHSGL